MQDSNGETANDISVRMNTLESTIYRLSVDGKNDMIYPPFLYAADSNDVPALKIFLSQPNRNEYLHQEDDDGSNALLIACTGGNVEAVKYLLDNGMSDALNDEGDTHEFPLTQAIHSGNFELVRMLIEDYSADLRISFDAGDNLFLIASYVGPNSRILDLIKQAGNFDLNARSHTGKTALYHAVSRERLDNIEYLISFDETEALIPNSPVDERVFSVDLLHSSWEHLEIVEMFLNRAQSTRALIFTDERLRNVQRVPDFHETIFDYFGARFCDTQMNTENMEVRNRFLEWAWPQMSELSGTGTGEMILNRFMELLPRYDDNAVQRSMERGDDTIINQEQFAAVKEELKQRGRENPDDCSICLEALDEGDLIKTECNHFFHPQCLPRRFLQCPMCNSKL